MAIHDSIPSLLRESITEYLVIADFCIRHRKDMAVWGSSGCFGYPAALLLFSIADSIGSYVLGADTKNHFKILTNEKYYNLILNDKELDLIYKDQRCLLTHNAALSLNVGLDIGENKNDIFEYHSDKLFLNLEPFLELTKKVVIKFLGNVDEIVNNSAQLQKILNRNNN